MVVDFAPMILTHFVKIVVLKESTTLYSSQQNGVAERMNRTLMEKARSMLSGAGLEQKFCAKVVAIACYLINKSPASTLVDKKPLEAWMGHKPLILKISESFLL